MLFVFSIVSNFLCKRIVVFDFIPKRIDWIHTTVIENKVYNILQHIVS
eukprot:UN16132